MKTLQLLSLLFVTLTAPLMAEANDTPQQCQNVRIGVVDWTDLHIVNGVAKTLLEALGYNVQLQAEDGADQVFEKMQRKDIDVFLGYWSPTMTPMIERYYADRSIRTVTENLNEARWTLAVPSYVYDQGLRDFADIARFRDKLEGRIYGLEKGSSGNEAILQMIAKNAFGLKDFTLVETTERLMMAQVKGRVRKGEWIVFMGWQPHPMNQHYDLRYLSGGDDYFGPDYGAAKVHTSVRQGLAETCPNLGKFFTNLTFRAAMEEEMMDQVTNGFVPLERAVRGWIHANPQQLNAWLEGVKTLRGEAIDTQQLAANMELKMGR
ncbi:glycine betaine ABC transporter substrate-binding protein [Parathalassolituus penaei]|uniref:Glycine/betaine ABC transporter substrate-binding protein n=1 Tax=Parathalassolituus penaei TaxID=2997323 RepID=A0A9X3EDC5_9GAMM|nr:glycine betaine ABC transporter substrate-binding protein [Parathalassolituus penaei]MCY0965096.1 glycine/betaine ABC transporter substrate-binding protein [Parathalassolituus penaei]